MKILTGVFFVLLTAVGAYALVSNQAAQRQIDALQRSRQMLEQGVWKTAEKITSHGETLQNVVHQDEIQELRALVVELSDRVLELESEAAIDFAQRVRKALAEDPQMIFDAVDLMNAQAAAEALALALPQLEEDPFLPVLGNPEGDVTLIEFYDYNCGFCRRSLNDVIDLVAEDGNIRLLLRELPVLSRESQEAALIALAAAPEVDFLALHRLGMKASGQVNAEIMLDFAESLGADRATIATRAAIERQAYIDALSQTQELASRLGITGTPAFIIGDQIIPGAVGKEELARAVAEVRMTKASE